jgi:hypothetical protein
VGESLSEQETQGGGNSQQEEPGSFCLPHGKSVSHL